MSIRKILGIPFLKLGNSYHSFKSITSINFDDGILSKSVTVYVNHRIAYSSESFSENTDEYKFLESLVKSPVTNEVVTHSLPTISKNVPTYSSNIPKKKQ